MKYIAYLSILFTLLTMYSCKENENVRFDYKNGQTLVYFKDKNVDLPVEEGGQGVTTVTLGVTTLSTQDRQVNLSEDEDATDALPSMYNVPSSVMIPAGEFNASFDIEGFYDSSLDDGSSKNLVINLESIDSGIVDDSKLNVSIFKVCPESDVVTLSISFDGYAEETSWDLKDSSGNVIESNAYDASYSNSSIVEEICLPDGSYTFTIYDAYGDGLYDGVTTGTYELKVVQTSTILASGSGNFGSQESTPFIKN
jgi:hypothetical protein